MRRLGPRVPETYPLVEMAAHDCRADRLRRDQIVATGSREFSLDACANISKFTRVTITWGPKRVPSREYRTVLQQGKFIFIFERL